MSVPLRATKGPAQLLVSSDLHHFTVIIKPATTLNSQVQLTLVFPDRSDKVSDWHYWWHWMTKLETLFCCFTFTYRFVHLIFSQKTPRTYLLPWLLFQADQSQVLRNYVWKINTLRFCMTYWIWHKARDVGVVLARKMARLPRSRCWFVGTTDAGAIDRSYSYNINLELGSAYRKPRLSRLYKWFA